MIIDVTDTGRFATDSSNSSESGESRKETTELEVLVTEEIMTETVEAIIIETGDLITIGARTHR